MMSKEEQHIQQWLCEKVAFAQRVAAGDCGGGYGDGVLVLSSVVSGIAAELWPGEGIDRVRFVEVWARYSDLNLNANLVSLPFLVEGLRKRGRLTQAEAARSLRPDCIDEDPTLDTLVVTGDRVDLDESELTAISIRATEVREYSYGNIFYRYFRSGYTHENRPGTHGDAQVMSRTRGAITYTNHDEPPYRRINFDIGWLASVVGSICRNAAKDYWLGSRAQPSAWWLKE